MRRLARLPARVVGVLREPELGAGRDRLELERAARRHARDLVRPEAAAGHLLLDRDLGQVVARQRGHHHRDVALEHVLEVEDHLRRRRAVPRRDVVEARRDHADVVGVEHPLPGVLEVVAGQVLAVGPLEVVAQVPGDRHRVPAVTRDLDAAVVERRDLLGEVGRVLVVVGERRERGPRGRHDVPLRDLGEVVRVELGRLLPVADDGLAAVRAARGVVGRIEQVDLARRRARRPAPRGGRRRRDAGRRRRAGARGRGAAAAADDHHHHGRAGREPEGHASTLEPHRMLLLAPRHQGSARRRTAAPAMRGPGPGIDLPRRHRLPQGTRRAEMRRSVPIGSGSGWERRPA